MPKLPCPTDRLPQVVFDDRPELITLYNRAWELAWAHVLDYPGAARSPYMDEGFMAGSIWIWDTCFMALFCKYAPQDFPGVESLNNFYQPLYDGAASSLHIHHLDNPPLLAWVEWSDFLFTGRRQRLKSVFEKGYLQQHFELMDALPLTQAFPCATNETFLHKVPLGYHWAGCPSGMDNTPRGGGGQSPGQEPDLSTHAYPDILWLDALAQQALSAECIANIARLFGDHKTEATYRRHHHDLGTLLNTYYWNEEDGLYYDILAAPPHTHYKVKTPATYWPMLAGVCSREQAARMAAHLDDDRTFGGPVPFPSVARDADEFDPKGGYWRGGVWVPLAYMTVQALERYGFCEVAQRAAEKLLVHMAKTYTQVAPHTIWEVYSPTEAAPATCKKPTEISRPDFCGWSALGPIAMLIEQVLGFKCLDAEQGLLEWRCHQPGRQGLRNLRFGQITADLIYDGQGHIEITCNHPFTLRMDHQDLALDAGTHLLKS